MIGSFLNYFSQFAMIINKMGIIIAANTWTQRFFASLKDGIIGKEISTILLENDQTLSDFLFRKVVDCEKLLFSVNGEAHEFFCSVIPIAEEEEKICLVGVKTKSETEKDFTVNTEIIHNIFDQFKHANVSLELVDRAGRTIYQNEVVKQSLNSLQTDDDAKIAGQLNQSLSDLVLEKRGIIKEVREYDSDHGKLYYDLTGIPLEKNEELFGCMTIGVEITKRAELEKKLIDSERMFLIGEMATRIMHDIRNPLQIIKSSIQLLSLWSKKENLEKVKLQSMLNHIDMAVNNVLDLMNDILQFSKPETVKKEYVDLQELISNVLGLISSSLDKHKIQYQVEMGEWTILGDSKLIQQALLNIVQNAIEAFYDFADERKLEFRGLENNSVRYLEIYNNGPLIQRDNLDRVFDTFFSTKGSKGTGLGLSITREIIEKIHGGRISCISDEKNGGTSFIIEFPQISEIDQVVDY